MKAEGRTRDLGHSFFPNIYFAKGFELGLNWVQHGVSRFGLLSIYSAKLVVRINTFLTLMGD